MSAKDSSISMISSLILSQTSFIIHAGVDAPAVIPTVSVPRRGDNSRSSTRSISWTDGQTSRQSSASFLVLELWRSPMTTIAPHWAASWTASSWRFDVAPHIVSKNSAFVHSFFAFFTQSSQIFLVDVVCDTKVIGRFRRSGASNSHFSNASAPDTTTGSRHQPAIAVTSGWSGVPTITGLLPCSSLGQVASKIWAPRLSSVL